MRISTRLLFTTLMVIKIKPITSEQLKLLWVLARQLRMDSDSLHEFIFSVTGKDLIRALSVLEAKEVIDMLVLNGAKVTRKKLPRPLPPNVIELVTRKQMKYIRDLEKKLGWQDNPERLEGFLKKIIKKKGVRTKEEGMKIIQGLKSMANREPRPGKKVKSIW